MCCRYTFISMLIQSGNILVVKEYLQARDCNKDSHAAENMKSQEDGGI